MHTAEFTAPTSKPELIQLLDHAIAMTDQLHQVIDRAFAGIGGGSSNRPAAPTMAATKAL